MQKKFNSVLQKEIENIEYKEKEQKKLRKKHGIDIEAGKTYIDFVCNARTYSSCLSKCKSRTYESNK